MELDWVLLGLIYMHHGATGYELNRMLRNSTGYLMATHLSHIYPALKRLNQKGLIDYREIQLDNRPNKKVYHITPYGENELHRWLKEPVAGIGNLQPFILKMAFTPLMDKATILAHIDSKIAELTGHLPVQERGISVEIEYLDKQIFNQQKAQVLWGGLSGILIATNITQITQLKKWRQDVEQGIDET